MSEKNENKDWVTFVPDPSATVDLSRIALALEEENEKNIQALEELNDSSAQETAERLAREIAEDEALAEQLSEEQNAELLPPSSEAEPQPQVPLDQAEVESCLEALLFMSDKPISINRLKDLLGEEMQTSLFNAAMEALRTRYQSLHHGIELVEVAGGLQLRTKLVRANFAKKLARVQTQRLSSGAMETLAIIAYRQPVMKDQIDRIRGVDSSHFVRGLLEKKLIQISGRSELPGRPMLYTTTQEFLELFGLKDKDALPSLRELEQMLPASEAQNTQEDSPHIRQMREWIHKMGEDRTTLLNYDPREDEKILKQMRERIQEIPITTPYIEEQKALEKQAELLASLPPTDPNQPPELLTQGDISAIPLSINVE